MLFCVLQRNSRWPPKVAGKRIWAMSPVDSADTLWVKNFVEITLSRSVSEINMFLRFTQKFKMAAKSVWENNFWGKCVGQKFRRNHSISLRFQDKLVFVFNAKILS